ncbi:MAG: hypothetical protein B7733_02250 [Myxococcales bacterium FL481]|nr:MAG: hypothetical protein B7733_02250 [Myxococcales bacterium FL481]
MLVCTLVLCLVWSSTWLVIAQGLRDLPPLTSGAARFLLAALVMALVTPVLAPREGGRHPTARMVWTQGGLNFAVSYGIVYWAETRLASGLVSILWATFPIMMAAVAHWMLPAERLRPRQWRGVLVAFVGVAWLFATDVRDTGESAVFAGAVLLLSPLASAVGTTYIKARGDGYSSVRLNRNAMLVGAVMLTGLAFALEDPLQVVWPTRAILTVVYLATVGTVLTFTLYFWALRYAPAYQLSLIAYVTPALAVAGGATFADETVDLHTVGGLALVLLGVGGVLRKSPAELQREPTA